MVTMQLLVSISPYRTQGCLDLNTKASTDLTIIQAKSFHRYNESSWREKETIELFRALAANPQ